jgi:DNA-directed RNA polymerase specialized sigma24 family protein
MDLSADGIKRLLKDYYFYKMQAANGAGGVSESLESLERCIDALDEENRDIMRWIFFDKVAVVDVAVKLHLSRQAIYDRVNSVVKRISFCLKAG